MHTDHHTQLTYRDQTTNHRSHYIDQYTGHIKGVGKREIPYSASNYDTLRLHDIRHTNKHTNDNHYQYY